MKGIYGQGEISARAAGVIPFGAFVYRSASGRVKATLSGLSAIWNESEPTFVGVALGDNVEDENNPGFYTSNDMVPIAASPGTQVNVLVRGSTSQIGMGDFLYPSTAMCGLTNPGTLNRMNEGTTSLLLSNLSKESISGKKYAVAKALEELDTSNGHFGNIPYALSAASSGTTLSFNASGLSSLKPNVGDYILHGSHGTGFKVNRIKKIAGRVITTQNVITTSQATTTKIYKLIPLRAVLL